MKKKKEKYNWPVTILLITGAVVAILLPLYMTIIISLKDPTDMINVLSLPKKIRLGNFSDAWELTEFPTKFGNTLYITIVNLIFTITIHSFVAYILTRFRNSSKFFNIIYYYLLSAIFIPFSVLMLPLAIQANLFHIDNLYGIVVLYVLLGLPMNVFLYSGAVKGIPQALDEAARIDGASTIKTFMYVIFPLLKSMTATVAILSFMWTWNDFTMPLIMLTEQEQQTLQLAQYVFKSQFSVDYNMAFASYVMVLLPIMVIYIFAQRWIMNGVVTGSVK